MAYLGYTKGINERGSLNNDTVLNQPITTTDNPQSATTNPGASDAKDFQQAAGIDALRQTSNGTLHVLDEGDPIQGATTVARPVSAYIPLVLVIAVLILVSMRLYRWVKAAPVVVPEPMPAPEPMPVTVINPATAKKSSKKSKKTSRSKRKHK